MITDDIVHRARNLIRFPCPNAPALLEGLFFSFCFERVM